MRSWTKRETSYKIPGLIIKRGKKRIIVEDTEVGNRITVNFLK